MSLLDRLTGLEEPRLPVHQFWGSLSEWGLIKIDRADVIAAFSISAGDESDLDYIKSRWDLSVDKPAFEYEIHKIFILAEYGLYGYNVQATLVSRINEIP